MIIYVAGMLANKKNESWRVWK